MDINTNKGSNMQPRNAVRTLLIACGLFAMAAHAAPPEGKGKHGKGQVTQEQESRYHNRDSLVEAGITAALAREYARTAGYNGYAELPPGIRKNLMRGKPLPPGIAKKVQSGAFLERLPRHSGYEWQTAGTELILVSVATGVIADILYDVFN